MKNKRCRSSSSSSLSSSDEAESLRRENSYLMKKLKKLKRRRSRKHAHSPVRISESDGSVNRGSSTSPNRDIGEKPTGEDPQDNEIEFVEVSLNDDIINALGGKLEDNSSKQGEEIHHDLAKRWDAILRKGLNDSSKENILSKYPTPSNCLSISPPKLNAEIKVAAKSAAVTRDTSLELIQSQTGAALTAIGKGLTMLLKSEEKIGGGGDYLEIIEAFSDSARLVSDLHFKQSTARQNLVSLNLGPSLKDMVENTSLDGFLFGDNLTERLKTTRVIEKARVELRKIVRFSDKPVVIKNTRPLNSRKPPRRNFRLSGKNQAQAGHRTTSYHPSPYPRHRSPSKKDKSYRSRRRI